MPTRKQPKKKRPVGRPTDYHRSLCAKVVALGKRGKSKAQIAAALGKSRQTIDTWVAEHPEFLDAISRAKELALAWWEDAGQNGLTGGKFNATAFIFQMKNRFKEDYRDQQIVEHGGPDGGAIPIRIGSLNDPQLAQLIGRIETALGSGGGEG